MMSNKNELSVQPSGAGWTVEVGQDGKKRPTSIEGVQLQRQHIRNRIEAEPAASDRSIARQIGCSPSTVASVRREVSNSGLEVGQARLDSDRVLDDTTAVYGRGDEVHIVVEPSHSAGFAFVSIVVGAECTTTERPIRRDFIPKLIASHIPDGDRIRWEYRSGADRVRHAMLSGIL